MEKALRRILGTFAGGLAVIGFVLAGLPIDNTKGCGSPISHDVDCAGTDSRMALVVLVLGLALTCLLAMWYSSATPQGDDAEPTIYPGGAQL